MTKKISEELLNMQEALLRAQLNVIRQLRKEAGLQKIEQPTTISMSQMEMVYDILKESRKPLHVRDIINAAKTKFDVQLDRESIVSALAKRVKRQDRFMKTGPNTFALISQDVEGGHR
jgi:hypothetical protein